MDQLRDTASGNDHPTWQKPSVPQKIDEAAAAPSEIASPSNIEERFANWGTD